MNKFTDNPMTNNTKPEGKEILREQFTKETYLNWINSQGEPDIDYVDWLESRLLSPSSTAPQGEEELRNRAESYATELVRIVICDEVEEDIASDDEVIEKYKDEWSIAADAYLAGAKGKTAKDLRNNH